MGTGYGLRNITWIPPSTSKSERGLHVVHSLYTVVVYHISMCALSFGGLPIYPAALDSTQLILYSVRLPLHVPWGSVSMCLLAVRKVLKEAR